MALIHLELSEEVLQSKGIFFLRKPVYKMAQDYIKFPHQNTRWESQVTIYFVRKTCLFLKTVFSITTSYNFLEGQTHLSKVEIISRY